MPSEVDVIIVSYNSARVLDACLTSVARVLPDAGIRIREHGSEPGSLEQLRQLAAAQPMPVVVEVDMSNPGFAAGCNALAAASDARVLLFLNPDTELRTWPWSSDRPVPAGTIIGPVMVDSGPPGDHYGTSWGIGDELRRSWLRRRGPAPTGRGFVSGAALLVDRESFEKVGGFDEKYFLFYEDIDFCLRANERGVATRVDERWQVHHARMHSTKANVGQALQWSYESACRFHAGRGSSLGLYRTYVIADNVARAAIGSLRRDHALRRAHLALARRAVRDLTRLRSADASADSSVPPPR